MLMVVLIIESLQYCMRPGKENSLFSLFSFRTYYFVFASYKSLNFNDIYIYTVDIILVVVSIPRQLE